MSVLHIDSCSDIHIGNYGTATDSATGENLGFLSNRKCRQFLLDHCRNEATDYGIFVGDLYRSAIGRPTQKEQWEASQFFREWSLICPVIAKPGNHDVDGQRADGVHALQIFDAMNLRMQVLPVAGWSVVNIEGIQVALFHGMLSGVRLESGLISDSVREGLPGLKDAPPADLYLLGDIHHAQFLAPNAAYHGALDRLNFGEEDETPGFWCIKIDRSAGELNWKRIETPGTKYVTITDEGDIGQVEVKDSIVRYIGELNVYTEGELRQKLLDEGAREVQAISNTRDLDEAPSIYSSFKPDEAFTVWLDAQTSIKQSDKPFLQGLMAELV